MGRPDRGSRRRRPPGPAPRNRWASRANWACSPVVSNRCTGGGGVVGARQIASVEHAVDVLSGLIGAGDQCHPLTHHQSDHPRQQRIVGAAEHQRVHLGLLQRFQVRAGQAEQRPAGGDAALDEVDELRAGGAGDADLRGGGEGVLVRPLLMVARVPITPTRPLRVAATARRTAGRITSTTGTGTAPGRRAGRPRRRLLHAITSALTPSSTSRSRPRERVPPDLGDRPRPVGECAVSPRYSNAPAAAGRESPARRSGRRHQSRRRRSPRPSHAAQPTLSGPRSGYSPAYRREDGTTPRHQPAPAGRRTGAHGRPPPAGTTARLRPRAGPRGPPRLGERAAVGAGGQVLPAAVGDHERHVGARCPP